MDARSDIFRKAFAIEVNHSSQGQEGKRHEKQPGQRNHSKSTKLRASIEQGYEAVGRENSKKGIESIEMPRTGKLVASDREKVDAKEGDER
jgi:hypothetical protein